jgi:hypothetical protein
LQIVLLRLWAISAAIACGLVVASLAGGRPPGGAILLLLILLFVCLVATRLARSRQDRPDQSTVVPQHREEPHEPRSGAYERVLDLLDSVPPQDLEWLGEQRFDGAWRDVQADAVRAVGRFDAGSDRQLRSLTDDLTNAARSFLRIYELDTVADPVTYDGSWRVLGSDRPDGRFVEPSENERVRLQTRLRAEAAAFCREYNTLHEISKSFVRPNDRRRRQARTQRSQ